MRADVRKKLVAVAKRGGTISYGRLMKQFGIPRGHRKSGIGIGSVLGEISKYERRNGRPLLSAIVVRAGSKTRVCPKGHTGGGFFGLPGIPLRLKRSASTHGIGSLTRKEQEFVRKEQERVWSYRWRDGG